MKEVFNTAQAPAPIGPYNQAIKAGPFLFVSGQIALVPATGELVTHEIEAETRQVMENIKAVLTHAGLGFGDIVKTTIFLRTMDDFSRVNSIYGEYFESDYPARETVAVAGLPRNVNVEISVTAYFG